MRLIHLTDPHLSSLDGQTFLKLRGKRRSGYLSWYKNRRHIHRASILEGLTAAVASHEPDLVLLTGDLVHIGLEHEFIETARWLRQLGTPEKVILVPGNHDNYARDSLASMYRHWGSYLPAGGGADGNYRSGFPLVRERAGLKLVGVNTACVSRIFSARGELGSGQRERLAGELATEPGDPGFLCLLIHHPPFPGMTPRRKELRDSAQLKDLIGRHPPDLVLYGHIHRNREHIFAPTRIYSTASASSAGTASFRIFDLEKQASGWSCTMRLMSLDPGAGGGFSVSAESSWSGPASRVPSSTGPGPQSQEAPEPVSGS